MFLGDARPHNLNDEWVFSDVDSIQDIIIPAARIALKVHQVCPTVCLSVCLVYISCSSTWMDAETLFKVKQ